MKRLFRTKASLVVFLLCLCLIANSAVIYLKKFTFDEDRALNDWKKMILNGEVDYTLIKAGDEGYVRAFSDKTCSALYYRIAFKPEDYPLLRWRWKALQFPDVSKATTDKEKDDYAARVYVIFPSLCFSASKFLEYVWSENMPVGTIVESPYGRNLKIIVIRSGRPTEEEWVVESRNMYEDYIKAFGSEPRTKAGAVAIMCDADSTKTSAEALFDDIIIEGQE